MDTLNPLALIDNLLADYAGPRTRRAIHGLILLVGLIVTVYLAAGRNWEQAIITLALSLYAEANKANTPAVDLDPAGEDSEPDDGLTYEEAEGAPLPEPTKPASKGVEIPFKRGEDPDSAFGETFRAPLVSGNPVVPTEGDETPRDAGL